MAGADLALAELALESLPEAVVLFSPDLNVELVNRAGEELFGFVQGAPLPKRHADWLLPLLVKVSDRRRSGRRRRWTDAVQLAAGGEERFFLPDAVVTRDATQRIVAVTVVLWDMTDLRPPDGRDAGMPSAMEPQCLRRFSAAKRTSA